MFPRFLSVGSMILLGNGQRLIRGVLARFQFITFQKSDWEKPCATVRARSLFRSSTL